MGMTLREPLLSPIGECEGFSPPQVELAFSNSDKVEGHGE
jgi:hypothetical protein